MKTMFQQFADARLTREQMKEVKGGSTYCNAVCVNDDGVKWYMSGTCSGSVSQCTGSRVAGTGAAYDVTCVNIDCYIKAPQQ
ncbi:hypothetical protein Emtol_0121 (plasmid) [Emticicia oligotrophica DSM 17448]|uniref:Natural product n=1 Tax=Emticicia oligotrophica (strain DSM 17448 / CIP 109782 / MTCC 6937 / GPTSA100-15) TaxID=929562 RepID=A0ABN4ASG0_EMTOG|nr:hypothetical protein [Emticicia oligotrophica]AFK05639.1 hypothetical protein Emtol_0121 [Emticicia oligotrophica DSM 17448]